MHRSWTAVVMTAVAALPVACSSTSTTSPSPTPTATGLLATPTVGAAGGSGTYTGPSTDMQWGPVQVTITVRNKRLTDVQATAPTERPRSQFINAQAVPLLRQEALQAQSANVDLISGATLTSEAFAQSLQGALQQAHLG